MCKRPAIRASTPLEPNTAGFTLIEVLVAFAILLLAAGAAYPVVTSAAQRARQSEIETDGTILASSMLEEMTAAPRLTDSVNVGLAAGLRWTVTVSGLPKEADRETSPITAEQLSIMVMPQRSRSWQGLRIFTARLGASRESP